MIAELVNNKKFKVALAMAGAVAIALSIYETLQSIQLNKAQLKKLEQS